MQTLLASRRAKIYAGILRVASRTGHVRSAAKALNRVIRDDQVVYVFSDGSRFSTRLHEAYWAGLLAGWEYEPEVDAVLRWAVDAQPNLVLFDAGANLGYWSVKYAHKVDVVAIEAVPSTYARLEEHAARNGFLARNQAVWDRDGDHLTIRWNEDNNEAASLTEGRGVRGAEVSTCTLSTIAEPYDSRPLVVKLDVEGAEPEAVRGASAILDRSLFIYEDHGRDSQHLSSRAMVDNGLAIFDARDGSSLTLEDLDAIKIEKFRGYNFAAAHPDGVWTQPLASSRWCVKRPR